MSDCEEQLPQPSLFKEENPVQYKIFASLATLMGMNEISLSRLSRMASDNRRVIKQFAALECEVKECLEQISQMLKSQPKLPIGKTETTEKSLLIFQPNESVIDETQKEELRSKTESIEIEASQVKTEDPSACQLDQSIGRLSKILNRTGSVIKNSSAFSNNSIAHWSELCLIRVQLIRDICTLIGHPMVNVFAYDPKQEDVKFNEEEIKVESDDENEESEESETKDLPEKIEMTADEICQLEKRESISQLQKKEEALLGEQSIKKIKDVNMANK